MLSHIDASIDDKYAKAYLDALIEKEMTIGKLKTEVHRLKFNTKLANAMLESPNSYTNINEVNAKRVLHSIGNLNKGNPGRKTAFGFINNKGNIAKENIVKGNNELFMSPSRINIPKKSISFVILKLADILND